MISKGIEILNTQVQLIVLEETVSLNVSSLLVIYGQWFSELRNEFKHASAVKETSQESNECNASTRLLRELSISIDKKLTDDYTYHLLDLSVHGSWLWCVCACVCLTWTHNNSDRQQKKKKNVFHIPIYI